MESKPESQEQSSGLALTSTIESTQDPSLLELETLVDHSQHPPTTKLLFDIRDDQCPIIYSCKYDIKFFGLQKLHPFDVTKWGRTHQILLDTEVIKPGQSVEPKPAEKSDLLRIHTDKYLDSLKSGINVAAISEVPPLACIPRCWRNSKLLKPLRYQVGGSILGTKLALERNWAINLGGGFHHCSAESGGGFCFYADISLCIKFAFDNPAIKRIMVVDLDAHQGNGHERDWGNDKRVFILDAFNDSIYPHDFRAQKSIRCPVLLQSFTSDRRYLELIESQLKASLENFPPHFLIYNAGTDIMENDPLGCLSITGDGIVERDLLVFSQCSRRQIPILMLTSGGYQRETAAVIARSIQNLVKNSVIKI
ncbi:unnamed protein product [Allacma fusca]|uniref:Histone deacetylase 11 n=1 Tax=Allacma fusca TaxID=39272 RepID=A0A8J2KC21_9HEXA|nr:unnamed protein product [Allacma fusca]